MTRVFVAAIIAASLAACSKAPQAPAPLAKAEGGGAGLPTASAPRQPEGGAGAPAAPGAGMAANPHAAVPAMPADEAHKGMGGAMGMGGMGGHGMVAEPSETDGNPLPLRKSGLGSADELAKALARVKGDDARKTFEEAFRLTFSADKSKRDVARAREEFEAVLKGQPDLAEAYRGLAYVAISSSFDAAKAEEYYGKALKLRPDYGEVHYALAFLFAQGDPAKGKEHLKKALELGVPDEQGLKKVYGR
jgi:hypothetical protein